MSCGNAGIAQLVEQLICNQQVGGSSPSTSSINLSKQRIEYGGIPEWPKGADCKSVVSDFGGSNPPSPTKLESSEHRVNRRGVRIFRFSKQYCAITKTAPVWQGRVPFLRLSLGLLSLPRRKLRAPCGGWRDRRKLSCFMARLRAAKKQTPKILQRLLFIEQ